MLQVLVFVREMDTIGNASESLRDSFDSHGNLDYNSESFAGTFEGITGSSERFRNSKCR